MSWGERSCSFLYRNDKKCKPEIITCHKGCDDYVPKGKLGYEAYCSTTDNKSLVTGDTLPEWEKLPEKIKEAWAKVEQSYLNN